MLDKQSGKVAYAVMGFGGFLGLGEDHHPVPWGKLNHDTTKNRLVTDITEQEVKGAQERDDSWYTDRDRERRTDEYYRVPTYWV